MTSVFLQDSGASPGSVNS
uniref:Uncharacterized protein n=1 Tax=Anguilla anguilla TaxID=7936 RepID=A0A0E9VI36_ANGAN